MGFYFATALAFFCNFPSKQEKENAGGLHRRLADKFILFLLRIHFGYRVGNGEIKNHASLSSDVFLALLIPKFIVGYFFAGNEVRRVMFEGFNPN